MYSTQDNFDTPEALICVANALLRLGNADAGSPMGGLEALGVAVKEGLDGISSSLESIAQSLDRVSESIDGAAGARTFEAGRPQGGPHDQ